MAVLINFKICDNAKECSGIAVCPTGALKWDNKNKKIIIDNSKCISCKKCEDACMVKAIKVAKTPNEVAKFQKEIDDDTRKISDLYVDRYGAQPVHPAFLITQDKFKEEVEEADKLTIAEVFNDDSIMCLFKSIPMRELLNDININYKKVKLSNAEIQKKYKIKELPSLLIFKNSEFLGKIEGYFDENRKDKLKKLLENLIKNGA